MRFDEIRPEDRLLLHCARTTPAADARGRCVELVSGGFDWEYFVRQANRHRIVPLVHRNVSRMNLPAPASISADLAHRNAATARRNLILAGKLVELLKILGEHQIRVIPYKGIAVAMLAYGNVTLRQFWDLDILVSPHDYRRARATLIARNGYEMTEDHGWECCLVDRSGVSIVDLHRGIAPDVVPGRLDFHDLWTRCELPPAGGIRTFCAEDMLIVLSVQLRKDAWETKDLRLSKICDIAELLRARTKIDWERVELQARRLGCQRALWLGVHAAQELLDAAVDRTRPARIDPTQLDELMAYIRFRLFSDGSPATPSPMSQETFHVRIREQWIDRLYSWYSRPRLRHAAMHLRPSPRDKAMISLPAGLGLLYYLVRPVRVVRDHLRAIFRNSKQS